MNKFRNAISNGAPQNVCIGAHAHVPIANISVHFYRLLSVNCNQHYFMLRTFFSVRLIFIYLLTRIKTKVTLMQLPLALFILVNTEIKHAFFNL